MIEKLKSQCPALSQGLLFSWMLAFPMFGPYLGLTLGPDTGMGGLVFLAGNLLGYLAIGCLSWRPQSLTMRLYLTSVLAIGTLIALAVPMPLFTLLAIIFVLGLALTPLVIVWLHWLSTSNNPHIHLSIAMITSNLLLILVLLTFSRSPLFVAALSMLPLAGAYILPDATLANLGTKANVFSQNRKPIYSLAAFSMVVFFIGGLWYRVYTMPSLPQSIELAVFDLICYIITLGALAWWINRKRALSPIAALTLSALGLGLLFAQTTAHTYARLLLSIGLAGADFYLWMTLWVLAKRLPVQKTFAFGLGLSLIPIALATAFDMYGVIQGYSRQTFFAVALGVTMLLLPLIFNAKLDIEANTSSKRFAKPTNLTESEGKVFALLAQGVSDQQIAEELYISRHTVKFHVRNILHKCDVPNRKVLLSRLNSRTED